MLKKKMWEKCIQIGWVRITKMGVQNTMITVPAVGLYVERVNNLRQHICTLILTSN